MDRRLAAAALAVSPLAPPAVAHFQAESEVEIGCPPAEPDFETGAPASDARAPVPGGAVTAITTADDGLTFGIPQAGHWSFAALGRGPDTEHAGEAPRRDAVLSVHAHETN
jgi:cobalt/nickel transport protein